MPLVTLPGAPRISAAIADSLKSKEQTLMLHTLSAAQGTGLPDIHLNKVTPFAF